MSAALYSLEHWPKQVHAFGFPHWKRPHVRPFLGAPGASVTFHDDLATAIRAAHRDAVPLVAWASKLPDTLPGPEVPVWRMEDGFLRSRGLGSDLLAAHSLVTDDLGIYYDPATPSRLERLLETSDFTPELLARACALRERVVALGLSKYNVGALPLPPLPVGREVHLVVGQVEGDDSIRRGGGQVQTNAALLAAVRARHPEAWIVYKPHPDVLAGNRAKGEADRRPERHADQVVGDVSLPALLPHVARLHTITSLSGFEMLLRGGRVSVYGTPFYAGWGLTEDFGAPCPRRTRVLPLDALVAATLLLYPRYYDWDAQRFITAEECVCLLASGEKTAPLARARSRQLIRLKRWLRGRVA